jgi:hypothetical protein
MSLKPCFSKCFLFSDELISWRLPFHFAVAVFDINVKPCHQPYGHKTFQRMKSDPALRSWARTCGLKPRVPRVSKCLVKKARFHCPVNYRRIMILSPKQSCLLIFYFFLTRDGGQTTWIKWIRMDYILVSRITWRLQISSWAVLDTSAVIQISRSHPNHKVDEEWMTTEAASLLMVPQCSVPLVLSVCSLTNFRYCLKQWT